MTELDVAKHSAMKKFEGKMLQEAGTTIPASSQACLDVNGDEDIVQTQETVSYVDPITKRRIEDPVRNELCGHLYDRESIVHMIRAKKGKLRCPIPGCSNQVFLEEEGLEEDRVAAAAIAAMEKRERRKKK